MRRWTDTKKQLKHGEPLEYSSIKAHYQISYEERIHWIENSVGTRPIHHTLDDKGQNLGSCIMGGLLEII